MSVRDFKDWATRVGAISIDGRGQASGDWKLEDGALAFHGVGRFHVVEVTGATREDEGWRLKPGGERVDYLDPMDTELEAWEAVRDQSVISLGLERALARV